MEPTTIRIPDTIEEARSQLGGLDRLLTAKEWERAAIVYAFTAPSRPGPRSQVRSKLTNLSFREFAELDIQGLRSHATVSEMHRVWQDAIDNREAFASLPGDMVALPARAFPGINRATGKVREYSYAAVQEIIQREPEVRERLLNDHIQEIGRSPNLAARVDRVYEEHHPVPDLRREPVSDIQRLQVFDFTGAIYAVIQRQSGELTRAMQYLESREELDELDRLALDHAIDRIAKCRSMLTDIEDGLLRASGANVDETFRRLVS